MAIRKYFTDKMAQADSRPKLIWKILNDALTRTIKTTDVSQRIDENSDSEFISCSKNIVQKVNKFLAHISNKNDENFSESSAFKDLSLRIT